MNAKPASLDQIERWMQSVMMHGGEVSEAIGSPEATRHIEIASVDELPSVIVPSTALDSSSRLEIYIDAYFERLLECLGQEFQATRGVLGDETFNALAFGYLRREPSHSYTLNTLGTMFPNYLRETRLHEHAVPDEAPQTWGDFIVELATFERVLLDVFDGPGSENCEVLDAGQLQSVSRDDWGQLRLLPAPCLRLTQFEHPVHFFWQNWKDTAATSVPAPNRSYLAINRRNYNVEHHELTHVQFVLLEQLLGGETLSDAIDLTLLQAPKFEPRLEDALQTWFGSWGAKRFFVGLRHA
jgi:hypothetical protein